MPVLNVQRLREKLRSTYTKKKEIVNDVPGLYPQVGEYINPIVEDVVNIAGVIPRALFNREPISETGMPNVDIAANLPVAPLIQKLIHRLYTEIGPARQGAQMAIKTMEDLALNKMKGEPYWESTELVPLSIAKKLKGVGVKPRVYSGESQTNLIKDYLERDPLNDPSTILYNTGDKSLRLKEGSPQIPVAQYLNMPYVPMRGWIGWSDAPSFMEAPKSLLNERLITTFKPSDIGLDIYNVNELIDEYMKTFR